MHGSAAITAEKKERAETEVYTCALLHRYMIHIVPVG